MHNKVIVSIIMPAYNAEKFIQDAINSVFAQTYNYWELIIIDDGSQDKTRHIIEQSCQYDSRVNAIYNNKNLGVIQSRNLGIKRAKGQYIAFLDADDLWLPQKLAIQIPCMQQNHCAITHTNYLHISESGQLKSKVTAPSSISYQDLLKTNHLGCLTVVYDQSILGKQFFEENSLSEDYLLWLKILKQGFTSKGLNQPLAKYRIVENSRSSNKINSFKNQWLIYRKREQIPLMRSIFYMLTYSYYGIKKRLS